jgi:hypothetical protein
LRGARGGDEFGEMPGHAFALHLDQRGGGDGLDLGYHQVRLLLFDQRAQGGAVGHGHDVAAVRHLHARRIGIAIDADHFATQALQCDNHFLAQFAAAQQHHARGGRRKRSADTFHDAHQVLPINGFPNFRAS